MTTTDDTSTGARSISQERFLEVLRSRDSDDLPDFRLQCLLWALMTGYVEPGDVWPAIFDNDLDALDDLIHDDKDEDSGPQAVQPQHQPEPFVPGYCVCGQLLHP